MQREVPNYTALLALRELVVSGSEKVSEKTSSMN
jgi:hypothetical protein